MRERVCAVALAFGILAVPRDVQAKDPQFSPVSRLAIGPSFHVAQRATLFADHGARGYRHAFLETGLVGERLLLMAEALGLAACPVGAFYDDEAADLVGVETDDEWVLHFAGLGMP